jgi:polar amino acid transport system substrate-binding protein
MLRVKEVITMKLTNLMCSLLLSFTCVFSFGQKITSVSIVTDEWENCTNANFTGLYFDIIRAVFDQDKIEISIKIEPYARSIVDVTSKKADMLIGAYKGELSSVLYPKWHLSADDVVACFVKGSINSWNGEKTLEGKRVSWIREYNYDKYILVKMNPLVVDKRENAINLLLKKRTDIFIDNRFDITATIKDMGLDAGQFDLRLIKYLNLYVCFTDNEKGKSLAATWDKNMEKLLKSNKIKPLFEEWGMLVNYNF